VDWYEAASAGGVGGAEAKNCEVAAGYAPGGAPGCGGSLRCELKLEPAW
jgi:hypothetical protein